MAAFRLYVDTNIFIYAFENNDALARKLLQLVSLNEGRKQPFIATSEIVLAELMVDPLKKGNDSLIELYDNISIGNAFVSIGMVTREVLWHAAQLRSKFVSLRLPDAIHLSTAMHFGCAQFLTADTRLKGAYSVAPDRLVPPQLTAEISIIRPEISVLDRIITEMEG
ncbi:MULTISPECIES: PIN domain-containing protein [unclassified Mesorhizobium]|uniref:type II toxin-antitoxin system VapC family toxin n=1 Tax=unclassified Mesorhizobium TaxID=325217 RepID=UPI00112B6265|nr:MULTISPECIES: PIN domain-containing protein [unclassified Mesorhizobium]TPL05107.1 PIN domain-containing protein [Mesorhizobium sp. B2-4-16]TPL74480.1 PIN domain-containing protein [Mesorhizobium sp. B2-4-3]